MNPEDIEDCELCGELFPQELLTKTFFWTVCDECMDHHDFYEDDI